MECVNFESQKLDLLTSWVKDESEYDWYENADIPLKELRLGILWNRGGMTEFFRKFENQLNYYKSRSGKYNLDGVKCFDDFLDVFTDITRCETNLRRMNRFLGGELFEYLKLQDKFDDYGHLYTLIGEVYPRYSQMRMDMAEIAFSKKFNRIPGNSEEMYRFRVVNSTAVKKYENELDTTADSYDGFEDYSTEDGDSEEEETNERPECDCITVEELYKQQAKAIGELFKRGATEEVELWTNIHVNEPECLCPVCLESLTDAHHLNSQGNFSSYNRIVVCFGGKQVLQYSVLVILYKIR